MATEFTAEQILDAMRVPTNAAWDVYQVGCSSSPLNFASQQVRAFQLVRALQLANKLEGKSIAVIGAGLAGVTAAISCLYRGASKVTLLDRNHALMALQSGATHRYVHPYIYRWPNVNAEASRTDFPVLNWSEGTADSIRNQVLDQVYSLFIHYYNSRRDARSRSNKDGSMTPSLAEPDPHETLRLFDLDMNLASEFLNYRLGTSVTSVQAMDEKLRLDVEGPTTVFDKDRNEFLPKGEAKKHKVDCDLVVVAVGFGLEREGLGIPFKSYWQQDTLTQPTIRKPYPRRWLVAGTGDGGLIEAVRLRLFDSDQKLLTDVLTGLQSPPIQRTTTLEYWKELIGELRLRLEPIDDDVRKGIQRDRTNADNVANTEENRNRVSRELNEQYERVCSEQKIAFEKLKSFIMARQRTDTDVTLSGMWQFPFEFSASPFQRFLIFLIIKYGSLKYLQGELERVDSPATNGARHQFKFKSGKATGPGSSAEPLEFDDVVVRFGANSELDSLFGKKTKEKSQNNELASLDEAIRNDALTEDWLHWPTKPLIPR